MRNARPGLSTSSNALPACKQGGRAVSIYCDVHCWGRVHKAARLHHTAVCTRMVLALHPKQKKATPVQLA